MGQDHRIAGNTGAVGGGETHQSPLPVPRVESLRPLPLGSLFWFWPAAAEAKLDVN